MLRQLTRAVIATCLWPPQLQGAAWEHGDFKYMVLQFRGEGGTAFLQLWSEPFEVGPIVEAASGRYGPLPSSAVSPRLRSKALTARGFSLPRTGRRNWQKTVGYLDEGRCAVLAAELLRLLQEVYGYDGSSLLQMETCHGTRLESAEVLTALRVDRLGQILRSLSIQAEREPALGAAYAWRCRTPHGHTFHAGLQGPQDGSEDDLFGVLCLRAGLDIDPADCCEAAAAVLRDPFISIQRSVQGTVIIARDEILTGGVRPRVIEIALRLWIERIDALFAAARLGQAS